MAAVATLSGKLLDYWVGRADEFILPIVTLADFDIYRTSMFAPIVEVDVDEDENGYSIHRREYAPTQYWDQGGPLMERERIYIGDKHGVSAEPGPEHWCCYKTFPESDPYRHWIEHWGSTLLEAAMRVFVEQVFGPEVPDKGTQ